MIFLELLAVSKVFATAVCQQKYQWRTDRRVQLAILSAFYHGCVGEQSTAAQPSGESMVWVSEWEREREAGRWRPRPSSLICQVTCCPLRLSLAQSFLAVFFHHYFLFCGPNQRLSTAPCKQELLQSVSEHGWHKRARLRCNRNWRLRNCNFLPHLGCSAHKITE